MARQPEVFARALEPAEAQRLVKITRTARDRVRLRRAGITETVRAVLREAGINWQATKTWKGSRDPDFAAKMARSARAGSDCADDVSARDIQAADVRSLPLPVAPVRAVTMASLALMPAWIASPASGE